MDRAEIFSSATEEAAQERIDDIASTHHVPVVVYTQYKPGSDDGSTERDAIALKLAWDVAGLVMIRLA